MAGKEEGYAEGFPIGRMERIKGFSIRRGTILFAHDAQTGKLIAGFGQDGKVSMNVGMRGDPNTLSVIPTSPGIVTGIC